jgi:hypothetical protein
MNGAVARRNRRVMRASQSQTVHAPGVRPLTHEETSMINRLRPANLRPTILAGLGLGILAACATTGAGLGTGHFRNDTSEKPVTCGKPTARSRAP